MLAPQLAELSVLFSGPLTSQGTRQLVFPDSCEVKQTRIARLGPRTYNPGVSRVTDKG